MTDTISVKSENSKVCTRYYHKFSDGKEGERVVFDRVTIYLRPDNKCSIVGNEVFSNKFLQAGVNFARDFKLRWLEYQLKHIPEYLGNNHSILTNGALSNIQTFDIDISADENSVRFEPKKGTRYESLGSHFIPFCR